MASHTGQDAPDAAGLLMGDLCGDFSAQTVVVPVKFTAWLACFQTAVTVKWFPIDFGKSNKVLILNYYLSKTEHVLPHV